jgi:Spy/CpxP family protein refolding chaperone
MKKQMIMVVLAVLGVLAAGFASFADPDGCNACGMKGGGMMGGMPGGGMGPQHHAFMDRIDRLNLDQNQKAVIGEIRLRTRKEMIKKRSDLQVALVELQEIVGKDPVDMKAAEAKLKQVEALRTAVHLTMLKEEEEIKAKLTPDQIKQLRATAEAGCGMDCKGHQEHGGHGPMGR